MNVFSFKPKGKCQRADSLSLAGLKSADGRVPRSEQSNLQFFGNVGVRSLCGRNGVFRLVFCLARSNRTKERST